MYVGIWYNECLVSEHDCGNYPLGRNSGLRKPPHKLMLARGLVVKMTPPLPKIPGKCPMGLKLGRVPQGGLNITFKPNKQAGSGPAS